MSATAHPPHVDQRPRRTGTGATAATGAVAPLGAADDRDVVTASVELLWIPLGAGQHLVRISGRIFETLCALAQRRRPCQLYHSALVVTVPDHRYVIEMTPVPNRHGQRRGVVGRGAVGSRWLGRLRPFQYEIRRWPGGMIPDADEAVETITQSIELATAERVLAVVASTPTPVWGRDELDAGEMWNSNSVTSWILQRGGIDTSAIRPPDGGRAPGWNAGLCVGSRAPHACCAVPCTSSGVRGRLDPPGRPIEAL